MKLARGKLFVFEGADDVGKTTLAAMLGAFLSAKGSPTQVLSFPGREEGTVSELIYRLYHNSKGLGVKSISPLAMQVMVTAAHIEVVETRLRPLMEAGKDVVLDRFWWSTWVYATLQGVSAEARDLMIELEMKSWSNIHAERIFLVHRTEPLLKQPEGYQWPKIVSLYAELIALQPDTSLIRYIDSEESVERTFQKVIYGLM